MPGGRPKTLTSAKEKLISDLFFLGFTDEQVALMVGVSSKTIQRARKGEFCPAIKRAELFREAKYRLKIWNADQLPAGICWMLERKYPTQFSRPEVQLAVQNNYTLNQLHITIGKDEVKEIEAQANPVRESVKEMYAKYRPQLSDGNGDVKQ